MSDAQTTPSITATCPQCHQTVEFRQDPTQLGPSGRDQSNLWTCSNPSCGYVAPYDEISGERAGG